MNNGIDLEEVVFFIDGKEIGTLNTIEARVDINNEKMNNKKDFRFSNREYFGTLENVEINKGFKDVIMNNSQKFTLVTESFNYPRGNKLPKKKRIRNKWMKKYYEKHTFENVEFY